MRTLPLMLLASLAGTILGCGQKGPLVLPDAQRPHRQIGISRPAKPAPAPTAPAPTAPAAPAGPGPTSAPMPGPPGSTGSETAPDAAPHL